MRSISRNAFRFAMVTSLCVLFYAQESWLYARSENGHTVELTQVDLFSLSDWQHKTVSVNGFILGMTRAKASELAQARRLKLLPVSLSEGGRSCEASCALYQDGGNWIGIDLFFDSSDRITMIKVGVPVDAYPEVKKVNVGRQFKGLTYQFFNHYTDGLRKRFLGDVEGKKKSSIGGASLTYVEYDYPQLGLVVHTTIDKRDHPPKPFDLEVDFVRAE